MPQCLTLTNPAALRKSELPGLSMSGTEAYIHSSVVQQCGLNVEDSLKMAKRNARRVECDCLQEAKVVVHGNAATATTDTSMLGQRWPCPSR